MITIAKNNVISMTYMQIYAKNAPILINTKYILCF